MSLRILVQVDGGPKSRTALHEGIKLAKTPDAEVKVIRVLSGDGRNVAAAGDDAGGRTGKHEAFIECVAAEARRAGLALAAAVVEGGEDPSDIVLAEAKRWRADLIITERCPWILNE